MRQLFILAVLVLAASCAFAISPDGSGATCVQNTTGTTTCTSSLTVTAGSATVLYVALNGTVNTSGVSDAGCVGTWTHATGFPKTQSGNIITVDAWYVASSTGGTCNVTVTRNSGSIKFAWAAQPYSGVASIGNTNTKSGTNGTSATITDSTQDNNNFVVAGFAVAAVETFAGSVGTLRLQASSTSNTPAAIALNDNTSASPATVTNTVTYGTSATYADGAIELRGSGAAGRAAAMSDVGANVLLQLGSTSSYSLNSTNLFPFWCAFPLTTGAGPYTLSPSGASTLNGQGSGIVLPQWQMTRVCMDTSSNFWMEPPKVATYPLLLTPSATALTFSMAFPASVRLTADSSAITATTAGTAATQFTFPTLKANTNYSFHCSGTTTQATAGAGIGIAITAATNAPTNLEAHARVATSATAAAFSSSGNITTTTATAVYTGSTGTLTTQLPFDVDGSIEVGASVPTVTIGFFTANASDAVTVKRDSYCTVMP